MNILLIFFALPIAVIIISAILQKALKCPIAVAALIFAIFLVVTFALSNLTLLIATLAYTLLALITAVIVKIICESRNNNICRLLSDILNNTNNNGNCANVANITNALNSNNSINEDNTNNTNSCGCGCRYNRYRRF